MITHMEEYRNKVVNYYATQSQIISKCTSNISKNTSNSTSKTDRIRLGGPSGLPGAPGTWVLGPWANNQSLGYLSDGRRLACGPGCEGLAPKAQGAPLLGRIHSREAAGVLVAHIPCSLVSSPDGPPDARGPSEVLVGGLFRDWIA